MYIYKTSWNLCNVLALPINLDIKITIFQPMLEEKKILCIS